MINVALHLFQAWAWHSLLLLLRLILSIRCSKVLKDNFFRIFQKPCVLQSWWYRCTLYIFSEFFKIVLKSHNDPENLNFSVKQHSEPIFLKYYLFLPDNTIAWVWKHFQLVPRHPLNCFRNVQGAYAVRLRVLLVK